MADVDFPWIAEAAAASVGVGPLAPGVRRLRDGVSASATSSCRRRCVSRMQRTARAATRPAGAPFLLVDGHPRRDLEPKEGAKRIELTVEPARKLTRAERAGVEAEAERIGAFLGLEPRLSDRPLKRAVACSASSRIVSLPVWPESSTTTSSDPGHAWASSQAVPTGEPRSWRPWRSTPGIPASRLCVRQQLALLEPRAVREVVRADADERDRGVGGRSL